MSFSRNGRNFRAGSGRNFPIDPSADTEASFAAAIADALHRDFGNAPAHVKHIARLTGANARTVQNWLHARNGPSGASLVVLMRHSDEVTAAVLKLSERRSLELSFALGMRTKEIKAAVAALLALLDDE
jgi:hypothetical protein